MRRCPITTTLLLSVFPFFAAAVTWAVSADAKLLSLVPADARIVAGMRASSGEGQPDSFLLVTNKNTVDLEDFFALSGADSTRVVHQVIFVAAANTSGMLREHSLLVSGHFDQARIGRAAMDGGASVTEYRGIRILVVRPFARERGLLDEVRWLAILDSNVLLFGTIASVQQELDRHSAGSVADPSLIRRLARMRRDDETWCVLSTPAGNAEIRNALAALDPKLADVLQGGGEFQFGIHYGRHVEFEYEVNTASGTDAQAISSSLTQSLAGPQPKESTLLTAPEVTTDGGSVHGVVKVSRAQYDAWLAEVSARSRSSDGRGSLRR